MRSPIFRLMALLGLLVAPAVNLWAAPCPPNLPISPNAITVQGASPDGLTGYPISVTAACPFDVIIDSALSSLCVTQCTTPWVVSQPDGTQTGTLSAPNQSIVIDCSQLSVAAFQLAGAITTGSIFWGVSNDGVTFTTLVDAYDQAQSSVVTLKNHANFSSPTIISLPTFGERYIEILSNGSFSGSVAVSIRAKQSGDHPYVAVQGFTGIGNSSISPPVLVGGIDGSGLVQFIPVHAPSDTAVKAVQAVAILGNGNPLSVISQLGDSDAGGHLIGSASTLYTPNDPTFGNSFARERTPNVFKTVSATAAGSTAVWTPAAGRKFRLQRYMIQVTEDAQQAVAGDLTIKLLDGASSIGQQHLVYVPAASLTSSGDLYTSPWVDLGNGVLSSAANNVLNVNLSAALTAGTVSVIACGTEE